MSLCLYLTASTEHTELVLCYEQALNYYQPRTTLRVIGAVDAAALRQFTKEAHGHGRENEKHLL